MFWKNFTMNCSFTDPGGISPSFLEESQDWEGGGRPYLKCLPLLHRNFSFLIVFNSTFNRYFQILLTYVYIYIYIYIYIYNLAKLSTWRLSFSRRFRDSRWRGSLTMFPAGNKTKRLSSVNHTTKRFIVIIIIKRF